LRQVTTARLARLIREAVHRLTLDLSGLHVYTEAASGPFAITAPLAALAGAEHVVALARPWAERSAPEVGRETVTLAEALGVAGHVTVVTARDPADLARADIVTNLGFVRPIDRAAVAMLKPTAVVPYMREAWEVRADDVDLAACRERGIAVFATDEHHPDVRVFDACGVLAVKLLLEAGIDVGGGLILVASPDPFGPAIADTLGKLGARVGLVPSVAQCVSRLPEADALVVADFTARAPLVADGTDLEPRSIARLAPDIAVVAFAGGVDGAALAAAGIRCMPADGCRPGRMGRTLADLGPRPVVDLHAAGLKVGAAAARARRAGLTGAALVEEVCRTSPAVPLPGDV
jgi:hypothetical protein